MGRLRAEGIHTTVISPPILGWNPAGPVEARFVRCPTLQGLLPRRDRRADKSCRQIAYGSSRAFVARLEERLLRPETMVPWVLPAVLRGISEARKHRARFVWAPYPTITSALAGALHARLTGLPFIFDMRDPFEPMAVGRRARWMKRIERYVCRHAHTVLVCTEQVRDYANTTYAPPGSALIANGGFDMPELDPRMRREPHQFTIRHVGVLCAERRPGPFLAGLALLLERRPELVGRVRVELVGPLDGDVGDVNAYLSPRLPEGTVELVGRVSRAEAARLMAESNLLLLIQHDTELADWTVPSKVFDYFAAGGPIMAIARNSELSSLLQATGHYAFHHSDTEGVAAALEEIIDEGVTGWQPTEAQRAALREYSWEALIPRIAGAIGKAVEGRAGGESPARG